ncbi:MAG: pyridoxamine 5'-phosphate oxidase family protein, partial [Fibrobacter sp.]|nr:pyridoxamine 5'-phosphate oxidase family protein [Fibrobacter sp.]
RSEVLECIVGHLHQFWKIDQPESELVVLEFIIEKAVLYTPMDGLKEVVGFKAER